jgi:PAS domain S-box-containing protein
VGAVGVETIAELLASAMHFLPEAVLLTEAGPGIAKIIFANEYFQQLTGYSMQEIAGRDLTLLQGPGTDVSALQSLIRGSGDDSVRTCELLLYKKGGALFWDRVIARQIGSNDQEVYCLQIHSDIGALKEVERQSAISQTPAATKPETSKIVHDFNNLFTAIMVYSGLLNSKLRNDDQLLRYTEEIMGAAQRGSQRVAEMLTRAHPETAKQSADAAQDAAKIEHKGPTLLLVEDEELVRRSVDAALSMRGYKILPAANADEAMTALLNYSGEIQLLVTDLSLPVTNGVELAQRIRTVRPQIKVLFVSGSGDDPRMNELAAGRESFFKKPFTPTALAYKIEELLNKPSDE